MKNQTRLTQRNAQIRFLIELFHEPEERNRCIRRIWRTVIEPVCHLGYPTVLHCRKEADASFDGERFIALLRRIVARYDERRARR